MEHHQNREKKLSAFLPWKQNQPELYIEKKSIFVGKKIPQGSRLKNVELLKNSYISSYFLGQLF